MPTWTCDPKVRVTPHPITILLADDHAVVRRGIREFLEEDPELRVIAEVGDGMAAWACLAEHRPHVAVLDIQMPHLNGVELTRRIKAEYPEVRVLILTAYDDELYVVALLRAGADGYVLKTSASEDLLAAVKRVHSGNTFLDTGVAPAVVSTLTKPPPEALLSGREREVVSCVVRGWTNREIARQLGISDRTVQCHLANIFAKLHVSSRTGLATLALEQGIVSLAQVQGTGSPDSSKGAAA